MTSARTKPNVRNAHAGNRDEARMRARRTFAAARLLVCANVFVHSQIHFDASRSAPRRERAAEGAQLLALLADEPDDDEVVQPPQRRTLEPTIH